MKRKEPIMAQRGRPRPDTTVRRDATIRTFLEENGPKSRNEIAEALGISTQLTYLALSRLADAGSVVRTLADDGSNVWRAA
jgi:predicted ArsR family transcriptional regulator